MLLFNKSEPLVNSPTSIAISSFADVAPIVGEDPFSKSEDDTIADYNSSVYIPQIVFLGLDERNEGLVYKEHYKGVPWFAVDVTPKGSVTEECEKLIKKVTEDGKEFSKGRMHMSLPAQEGKSFLFRPLIRSISGLDAPCASPKSTMRIKILDVEPYVSDQHKLTTVQLQSMPRLDTCSIGTQGIRSVRPVDILHCR